MFWSTGESVLKHIKTHTLAHVRLAGGSEGI